MHSCGCRVSDWQWTPAPVQASRDRRLMLCCSPWIPAASQKLSGSCPTPCSFQKMQRLHTAVRMPSLPFRCIMRSFCMHSFSPISMAGAPGPRRGLCSTHSVATWSIKLCVTAQGARHLILPVRSIAEGCIDFVNHSCASDQHTGLLDKRRTPCVITGGASPLAGLSGVADTDPTHQRRQGAISAP